MTRTPAGFTQVARTIRAAKQAGAGGVDVRPDGTIQALARVWGKISRTPRLPDPPLGGGDFPMYGEMT